MQSRRKAQLIAETQKKFNTSVPNPQSFYNFYNLGKQIGSGGYGMVWVCEDKRQPGNLSAVKIIAERQCKRKTFCQSRKALVPDEVALWTPLNHPSIMSLNDVYYESHSRHWYLLTDYDPNFTDLFNYIDHYGAMRNTADAANIVTQLIEACYYLAGEGVDHRDIKDENVLYNPVSKKIKIIDFGSASALTTDAYFTYQGTDVYLPPEFYRKRCYEAFPACVWAIGCLAYVLLCGDCPFATKKEVQEFAEIKWKSREKLHPNSVDFVDMCLVGDPNRRLELGALIHHPWIAMHRQT